MTDASPTDEAPTGAGPGPVVTPVALRERIDRWLAAWTGDRPEELLAHYHHDVRYRDPARPDGIVGRDALDRHLRALLGRNPAWRWSAVEVLPTPTGCAVKWEAVIPTPRGDVVEVGLDIVDLDAAGLITRNEVYFDPTRLLVST